MTKYKLEKFEKWLEENNEKRNLGWEEQVTRALKRVDQIDDLFEWFISKEVERQLEKGIGSACQPLINAFVLGYQNKKNVVEYEALEKHQKIVKIWMDEVAQELKITALENQLINLAKQKLKGKKEAKQLLTQLESNWTKTEQDYLKNIQEQKQNIHQKEQSITVLKDKQTELTTNIQELKEEKKELATSLQLHQTKISDLETQLTSLSRQKISKQTELNRTYQKLTQTQTHYEWRKKQAIAIGIIGLAIILYLTWPLLTTKEKEAPRTWT